MPPQTVLLFGAYGQNNIGDDALLQVFLDQLGRDTVIVNSAQPEQTARRFGVRAVPTYLRLPRFARLRAMTRAELVVFGGGSLLKEIEGSHAARLAYFARLFGVLGAAKLTRARIAMIGVGMGPLHGRIYRSLSRIAANMTDLITVRDEPSRALLAAAGARTPIEVTADPVFTAALVPSGPRPPGAPPTIAVVPRYSLTNNERAALANACDAFIDDLGAAVTLIVFQTGFRPIFDDAECARDVRSRMRRGDTVDLRTPATVEEAMAAIGATDLIVSARLHGLIFAAIQGVPGVAISYDMKVRSFMEMIGRGWASLSLAELRAGKLAIAVERDWPDRRESGERSRARVAELSAAAHRNFAILAAHRATWNA